MGGQLLTADRASRREPAPWSHVIGPAASQAALVVLLTLGVWTVLVPAATGMRTVAITSGSMHPGLDVGDIVLVDRDTDPRPGHIATFVRRHGTTGPQLVTHRLTRHGPEGWRTRGDANRAEDPWIVTDDELVGVGRVVVPLLGLPVAWARQGRADLVVASGVAIASLVWSAGLSGRRRGGRHLRRTLALRIRRVGTGLLRASAVVVVVALALGNRPAAAPFIGDTGNPGSSFAADTLAAPTGLVAAGGCRLLVIGPKVELSWDAVAGATAYEIRRDSGSGFTLVATVAATTHTDVAVAGGTTYDYRVRALVGSWSSPDATASATTPPLCL